MPKSEYYPDITRPGDSNFTHFPKLLPEDCVEYIIHILTNPPLTAPLLRSRLSQVQRAASDLCKSLLSAYIWQREAFALALVNSVTGSDGGGSGIEGNNGSGSEEKAEDRPPQDRAKTAPQWHLSGRTSFGDSIADEWLIVHLLRETSKKFPEAWIRVFDSDGEFLLVEAANVLPKWLNPEIAENRVWINNGQLRIIPRELPETSTLSPQVKSTGKKGDKARQMLPREMSLQYALDFITEHDDMLIYSPLIQEEAFYRLRNYPEAIKESIHTGRITIPRNLTYILHRTPAHISPAIEAFYLRDPISLRPLQAKAVDKLRFPPKDLVTMSVKFTRVGYAQLKSQEFPATAAWTSVLRNVEKTEEWGRRELGMKVACGFEMMLADPQNRNKRAVREIEMLLEDVADGEEELSTDEEMKGWEQGDDSDKWMDVNFEDFERELAGKRGDGKDAGINNGPGGEGGFGDKTAQENLRKMVERFEKFLNDDDAGEEGAEFSDEMDYDNDDDDNADNDDCDDGNDDNDDNDSEITNPRTTDENVSSNSEEALAEMMKQMMSAPSTSPSAPRPIKPNTTTQIPASSRIQELDSDAESESGSGSEEEDMKEVMKRMERELRLAGTFDTARSNRNRNQKQSRGVDVDGAYDDVNDDDDNDDDDENNAQYQLVKNMLESFKGQVGVAGPAGNFMNAMGVRLPRHEEER